MTVPLTKVSVARRQLTTAIELFFANRDIVSIYSLAANAWEVIDELCRHAEVSSMSEQTRQNVPDGKDLKRSYINSPYRNFFKHAENDAEAALEPIPTSQVESVLFLATEDYLRLNKRAPIQLQVFQVWYLAKYPEKLDPAVAGELATTIQKTLPDISIQTHVEQLARGADLLAQALCDPEILADPRTEAASE